MDVIGDGVQVVVVSTTSKVVATDGGASSKTTRSAGCGVVAMVAVVGAVET